MPSRAFLERMRESRGTGQTPNGRPLAETRVLDTREELAAVLFDTPYGLVWIALYPGIVARLEAEESALSDRAAILTPVDISWLRGLPEEARRDVIATLREFPGARMLQ